MNRMLCLPLLLALSLFSLPAAADVPVLDVSNPAYAATGTYLGMTYDLYQQSFTVNTTGTLAGFNLFGKNSTQGNFSDLAPLKITVGSSTAWYSGPWAAELSAHLASPYIDLSAYDIQVHAGDTVIFQVGNSGAAMFYMQSAVGTLRDHRVSYPAGVSDLKANRSLAFNAYVLPAAGPLPSVPEPSAPAMLIAGIAALALVRRRPAKQHDNCPFMEKLHAPDTHLPSVNCLCEPRLGTGSRIRAGAGQGARRLLR